MAKANQPQDFVINGSRIKPGERLTLDLPVGRSYTHAQWMIPAHIVHGRKPGAKLFVSAAIHGDELNGVEIIRRLLKSRSLDRLRGTLIAIPIVNIHGFITHSRYLPDRRDLNRSFPGSNKGSLAARLAHLLISDVIQQCTHGIDIHTGSAHRYNLPQIRADLNDPQTLLMARHFQVPVIINSSLRDGSLRQAAVKKGVKMLLYEAGEALRFDEISIRIGVRGIISVMRHLSMLPPKSQSPSTKPPAVIVQQSRWVRAPVSGIIRHKIELGALARKKDLLAIIADAFGEQETEVRSPIEGIIIGKSCLPLANEGDALYHIAQVKDAEAAVKHAEQMVEL